MQCDLQLARMIQTAFLPRTLPVVAGYEFFGFCETAREVGGDYYAYIPLPGGRLAVAVGDVAGKGVLASLLMAKLSGDIRFSMICEQGPAAICKLNDLLYEFTSPLDRFVTLAAVILDPATHAASLVSAGHRSPLLYCASTGELRAAIPRDVAGVPLGIVDGFPFTSYQITLAPGDSLVMFTDGVNGSMSATNVEFGMEGVERVLREAGSAGGGPKQLVECLVTALDEHDGGRPPLDDFTIVALGRLRGTS
jgi:serine phosphatase RsbU (regulator of sigma subunit)